MLISFFPKSCCLRTPEVLRYSGAKKKDESLVAVQKSLGQVSWVTQSLS